MVTSRIARTGHAPHHAVKFYGEKSSLFETVSLFLSGGLSAGQPAIIIATKPHVAGILDQLQRLNFDVESARRLGDLVVLDADEMLSLFMIDDVPNADLFEHNIGGLIQQTLCGQSGAIVRAYGEMVDVLWKQGRTDAAIKLEILWNKLALKHQFDLLCSYAMGSFYKQPQQFEALIAQHTHVVPADSQASVTGRPLERSA